ncbi:uncharacterized protein PFL1_00882 [Pseudozyma flocculosa PF-1]|uniref:glutathione transferase n=1 Tax=Pseudozyma flocculosa TaxID=84751 RepID=A0A5C3F3I3_9BASI|nr:uncharacterized protein PFL1_00882 [Pseudozyma flocculosa PF-1]EPQ31549.1 hypothetical protein PFL1_00882 [Pseudozyma flocculosa PF-1]SPO38660.1 related to glutathione S-transferase [Pseudozyma flocculosa]
MTIIVHHLNNSRSQRVLWLLEEMGIPYEIKHYQRGADKLAPKELRDVHPLGKSPVITDTARANRVVAESGAIVDYLIRHYGEGRFVPTDADKVDDDVFWSHFAEGSLMPTLVMRLVLSFVPAQAPFFVRPIARAIVGGVESAFIGPNIMNNMSFVGNELDKRAGGQDWLAGGDKDGNPTAADFQMAFPLEAALSGRVDNLAPSVKAYVDRIHNRPAYKRALEKGGPYAYA